MIETTEAYGFTFSIPAGDRAVGRCLKEYGEFGRVGSTVAAQLSEGATFVDVGANLGAYALPAARRAARVVAIEAQAPIADLLRRNVEQNGMSNVEVICAVAGSEPGVVQFPAVSLQETGNFGAIGIGRWTGATVETPMITLDDVAPADTRCVKIDVEGYEAQVLAGAERLIREARPYWLVEAAEKTPSTVSVIERFRGQDYRLYWFYDPFITPRSPKRPWDPAEPGDIGLLAAPRSEKQPVGMVEVEPDPIWPTSLSGFEYLHAFGIGTTR